MIKELLNKLGDVASNPNEPKAVSFPDFKKGEVKGELSKMKTSDSSLKEKMMEVLKNGSKLEDKISKGDSKDANMKTDSIENKTSIKELKEKIMEILNKMSPENENIEVPEGHDDVEGIENVPSEENENVAEVESNEDESAENPVEPDNTQIA